MKKTKIDIPFLSSIIILVGAGYLIFTSASLGLLSKQGMSYGSVTFNQTIFGLVGGSIACFLISKIDYKIYRKFSPYIFILSCLATLLVFVPHLGVKVLGAARWIHVGSFTFQTSELLKIGFIIYLSAWLAKAKDKTGTFSYGFLPFLILSCIVGLILLKQPDTDTFIITIVAGLAVYLVAGGRWKYVFVLVLISIIGLGVIAFKRPYVMSRIMTFVNPANDALGSGYQIQQSLIAIGSGGLSGRGFGQSIQKFNYLPEPIGDSIFAVFGEEFGFVGTISLIVLFIFFAFRGLKIASQTPDAFGRLTAVGIVILIVSQTFVNMSAMVGIMPLSGITLPFVSHGGTALFMTLAEVGIVLNISKSAKK